MLSLDFRASIGDLTVPHREEDSVAVPSSQLSIDIHTDTEEAENAAVTALQERIFEDSLVALYTPQSLRFYDKFDDEDWRRKFMSGQMSE